MKWKLVPETQAILLFAQVSALPLTAAHTGHGRGPGLGEPSRLFHCFIAAHLFPFFFFLQKSQTSFPCLGFQKNLMPFWYFGFSPTYEV